MLVSSLEGNFVQVSKIKSLPICLGGGFKVSGWIKVASKIALEHGQPFSRTLKRNTEMDVMVGFRL